MNRFVALLLGVFALVPSAGAREVVTAVVFDVSIHGSTQATEERWSELTYLWGSDEYPVARRPS